VTRTRILAVTPYYAPEGGGLERYAHAILSRLVRRGHDVRVLTFTQNGVDGFQWEGVPVGRMRPRLRLGNAPVHPRFRARVSQAIRSAWPDVVLAHTPVPYPAEMAYLAAAHSGVPFVVTYHSGRLRGSTPLLDGLASINRATLERRMIEGATGLIAVGPYVRDHALASRRDAVRVIPPGVDVQHFRPGPWPEEPNILFVGPLSESYRWKGVDVLWDAFERVRRQRPEAVLTLVGSGDRFDALRERAAGLGGSIRLLGRVSEDELVREYQRAHLVALPSTTDAESFGMVLAEANACGRPVVASRIGGIPDYVREGDNGLLVDAGDPRQLSEAILAVLDDPAQAALMGERGRQRVLRDHDWDNLTLETENVLLECAHRVEPLVA